MKNMQDSKKTDFELLALKRRSIRKFSQAPLSEDEVVSLMRAALSSPSSKGKKAVEFTLIDDAELLLSLSRCKPSGAAFAAKAPLAIVVAGRADLSDVWVEDASAASTALLFSAEAMGLGACWVQLRERFREDGRTAAQFVKELLNMPPYAEPLAFIVVGHKAEERPPHGEEELPWEHVHFGRWEEEKTTEEKP